MTPDEQRLWEEELTTETPGPERERLNRLLAGDPQRLAAWVADRQLALRIAGLAPHADTAERVWLLLRARRTSRRMPALRLHRRPRRRLPPWLAAGLAASLVLAGLLISMPAADPSPELWRDGRPTGATLASLGRAGLPDAACELRWPDGSRAELSAGSTVTADPTCAARLDSGSLLLQVAPQAAGRRFAIATRESEIAVVGTRFRVDAGAQGTRLAVQEGVVDLIPRGAPAQRTAAGECWQIAAGSSAAQRLETLWGLPEAGGQLQARVHRGTTTDDGYGSVPEPPAEGDRPTQILWFSSLKGQHVFTWRPGLTAVLRLRITAGASRIGCQIYIRRLQRNFAVFGLPRPDADGWADLRLPLDLAAPYQPSKPPVTGDKVCDLVILTEDAATSFTVTRLSVEGPATARTP